MPLKGKYLKYSPEITLEIFTLVWDKLIENGCKFEYSKEIIFERFKFHERVLRYDSNGNYVYPLTENNSCKKTTVQEILGYDPFVKDDFVLPDKWCIKTTKDENGKLIGKWFDKQSMCRCYYDTCFGEYYNSYNLLNESIILGGNLAASFASLEVREGYIEITFEQFKKYILKQNTKEDKEVIPEYVECISNFNHFTKGKIYNWPEPKNDDGFIRTDLTSIKRWELRFKPSTKEAFDAQNKPIEKWSVGSYVVFLKDNLQANFRKRGDISEITHVNINIDNITFGDGICNNIDGEFSVVTNLKWFATKSEAEEFAKTLINSKKLLSLNNWYQSDNHIVYLYERNKVYGFHHDKWFASEGFSENDLKYVDSNTVEEKFTNYIKNNYLIGQSFIDLVNKIDFQIKSYDLNFSNKTTQIYIPVEPNDLRGNKTARIFDKGVWAKCSSIKSNKQAVHCTIQEEWDFVTEKLGNNGTNWFKHPDWGNNKSFCISCEGKNQSQTLDFYINAGHQILSFQEWCDLNGYKMKKKVKFEVGKWYKAYYAKKIYFLKYKNTIPRNGYNQINCSEFINNGVYKINDSISNTDLENSFKVLDDLEEIQQYLPDDHPDKIKNDIKFKVGDWVFAVGNLLEYSQPTIGKIDKFSIGNEYDSRVNFYNKSGSYCTIWSNVIRHATPEEIYNHSVSIGQIPAGEPLNTGIEPNKDGMFNYTTIDGSSFSSKCSTTITRTTEIVKSAIEFNYLPEPE